MRRCLALAILTLFFVSDAFSGQASPEPVKITQPDGTTFTARIMGDEHMRWIETGAGYTVVKNRATDTWEYAVRNKSGALSPSGRVVGERGVPATPMGKHLRPSRNELSYQLANKGRMKMAGPWEPSLVSGPRNLMFIAVNFSDRALITDPADWDDAIFSETPGVKTVANFYKDNSRGLLQPTRINNSQGSLGVVEVSISTKHPNTGNANLPSGRQYRIETGWINDALAAATQFIDFNALDTNGDGDLTLDEAVVYFIVAGYDASGSANEPSVWAHKWSTSSPGDVMAGNVQVNRWAINGELYDSGERHSVGVITHELGHLMCALPDLYDIAGNNAGMGSYSLMAGGSWGTANTDTMPGQTPVNMDAWCRYVLGWAQPRTPADGASVSFGLPLATVDAPVLLRDTSASANEYFLVENRYPTGWDLGMQNTLETTTSTVTAGSGEVASAPMTYTPTGNVTGTAVDCGLGGLGEFPPSVNGQIALISRGTYSFVEKVTNAMAAGATAAIIYNNTTGVVNGTLGGPGNYIPAVGISQADGPGLAGQTVTVDVSQTVWDGGLLVQHIDTSVGTVSGNNINSSSNAHQGVTVEEASSAAGSLLENGNAISGDVGHLFYAGNSTTFDGNSTPNSDYYDGSPSGMGITAVSGPGATMTATIINGGGSGPVAPVANFSYAATLLSVNFTDASSDSDGSVVSWAWDFGDGNGSSAQSPSHSYAASGSYSVSLTVTDNDGMTDTITQTVTVSDGSCTPTVDQFTGSVRKGQVMTHTINVCDGVIDVDLSWSGNKDLDVALVGPGGGTVASSATGSNPESISYDTGGVSGTYTIEVTSNSNGPAQSYSVNASYEQ